MTDAPEKITVSWTYHEDRNPRPVITTDDPMANNWGDNDVPYLRADIHEKAMEGIRAKDELLDHVKAVLIGALDALHSIEVSEGPDLSEDKELIENAIANLDNERLFGIHEPVIVLDKFAVSPSD